MPALTPAAEQLLHHLTHHHGDTRTPIHYLNRGTWQIGDHHTAPDHALTDLHTAGHIDYQPGPHGGTTIHLTPAGHTTTQRHPTCPKRTTT